MYVKRAIIGTMLLLACGLVQANEDLLSTAPAGPIFPSQTESSVSGLKEGTVRFIREELDLLIASRPREPFRLPTLDAFTGSQPGSLDFQRIDLFARNSSMRLVSKDGVSDVPRDGRYFFIASNERLGIGLAVNPHSGETTGYASSFGRKMKISGNFVSHLNFEFMAPEDEGEAYCGTEMNQESGIDATFDQHMPLSVSAALEGELISYQAVVAIDTDNEWMAGKGNNPTVAQQWITDLFLAMNVFYERDVETRLLIGDTILRVETDPYSEPSNRFLQLSEFGEYWMENMNDVDRQFAAMFSGRGVSSGYFSGIAWLNQYCQNGYWTNGGSAVAGSYSFNAIGTNRGAGTTALYVGHEIGHNMGSPHTHCYIPEVDECYNGEGSCYSGTPACPAGGKGTIMSYCHVSGQNGAGCGSSNAEFHPTVQTLLESRLSTNLVQGCIQPYALSTSIFSSSFE